MRAEPGSGLPCASVTIRPVRADDAEALNEIRRQPGVADGTLALPSERLGSTLSRLERLSPDDHVFVAVLDGRVVGIAGLHVGAGKYRYSGSIGMMVHEQYQGRGVGRRLLETLLDLADNYLGLARVDLDVFTDNERAIRLYERLGFEREGVKRRLAFRRGRLTDVAVMARLRADTDLA
ncbi:MAG: GNAT family N-acetyltransferase [Chloroflexi bacterium]|nr:GNAT family N-acetyltransferase [Chloroflexota bacterium]